MRSWLRNGFNEWGRPIFYIGVLTMLVGSLLMMTGGDRNKEFGVFSVEAGSIECMAVLFWGWLVRRVAGEHAEEGRPMSRTWVSRDRTRRAVRENFPDDAEQILSDIDL